MGGGIRWTTAKLTGRGRSLCHLCKKGEGGIWAMNKDERVPSSFDVCARSWIVLHYLVPSTLPVLHTGEETFHPRSSEISFENFSALVEPFSRSRLANAERPLNEVSPTDTSAALTTAYTHSRAP